MRIAIIGGVAGGAGAAAAARRANETAEIDLFEAGPYISFANCGLPYYLSGEIAERGKLLVTSPELMSRRFNIRIHARHEVVAIDRAARTIRVKNLAAGSEIRHAYDRLIIATGAKAIRPATPGIDHPRVIECRTIDDIERLSALTREGARALVIGGGFIGTEVAEALVMRKLKVTLLDLAPQVLPPLDPEIASAARDQMTSRGIALHLGTKAVRLVHGETESVAHLSNGQQVVFDLAVLSIGVTPDTSLAKAAGLEVGATGGIVVDQHQQTSDPNIYAAGDVTELLYWPTHARMKLALAGPANKQARVAGHNAAQEKPTHRTTGAAGTAIVRVFDLALGITGLSEKAAAALKIPHNIVYTQNPHHASYFPGAKPLFIKLVFSPEDGRVLGGQVFGDSSAGVDKRLDVLATAIQARFTVDDLADLDLAYAPPFGSAKDPLIIAGMAASNVFHGRSHSITPRELSQQLASALPPFVLDVRSEKEFAAGKIPGAVNVPVEILREKIQSIPKNRPIVVHCAVGYRGYVAEKMLRHHGMANVRNLTGGFRAWQLWSKT